MHKQAIFLCFVLTVIKHLATNCNTNCTKAIIKKEVPKELKTENVGLSKFWSNEVLLFYLFHPNKSFSKYNF